MGAYCRNEWGRSSTLGLAACIVDAHYDCMIPPTWISLRSQPLSTPSQSIIEDVLPFIRTANLVGTRSITPIRGDYMRRLYSRMSSTLATKQFGALRDGAIDSSHNVPKLKGVVFDMDGTLCLPQNYMFGQMRAALGIPKTVDILHHIESLPPDQQPAAQESIRAIEREAMKTQTPQPGVEALMSYLESRGIRKAICTRNFDIPVQHLLSKFLGEFVLHPVVTREFKPPKPDPAGILYIAKDWGLEDGQGATDATGLIMVGDSIDDMTAGRRAGAATVLLVNEANKELANHEHTDLIVHKLDDLIPILERGFQGREIVPNKIQ
ncbi:hydrolase [Paramyrothecium foliicola]|nr:hydrolase [Paramyrothecium foliicola]